MESVNLSLNTERKRVLVAGGGMVGCETAHLLATYGRDVTIVEALPEPAGDMPSGPRHFLLQGLEEHKVKVITLASIFRPYVCPMTTPTTVTPLWPPKTIRSIVRGSRL